jgi:hypothetical protein
MVPIPTAIMKEFPSSTASLRNAIFTPKQAVVWTGFAFHPDFPHSFPRKAQQWRASYPNQGREIGREW